MSKTYRRYRPEDAPMDNRQLGISEWRPTVGVFGLSVFRSIINAEFENVVDEFDTRTKGIARRVRGDNYNHRPALSQLELTTSKHLAKTLNLPELSLSAAHNRIYGQVSELRRPICLNLGRISIGNVGAQHRYLKIMAVEFDDNSNQKIMDERYQIINAITSFVNKTPEDIKWQLPKTPHITIGHIPADSLSSQSVDSIIHSVENILTSYQLDSLWLERGVIHTPQHNS